MFWADDMTVLFAIDNLLDFFPDSSQSIEENLNSITRLSFYISISLALYKSDYIYMTIFIAVLMITLIIYKTSETDKEGFNVVDSRTVNAPSVKNPFMNPTMGDYLNVDENGTIIPKQPALNSMNPNVAKDIETNFYAGTNAVRDVNDLFDKNGSEREFYTIPGSSIPHDREEFQSWVYKSATTCKQDPNKCLIYEDIRYNRPEFPDKYNNPLMNKK